MWPARHGETAPYRRKVEGTRSSPFFGQILTSNRESFIAGVAGEDACRCVPTTVSVPAVCFIALWLVCGRYLHRPSALALAGIGWGLTDGGYAPTTRPCPSEGLCQTQAVLREENACPLCFHHMHAYTTGFVTHPFGFCNCI